MSWQHCDLLFEENKETSQQFFGNQSNDSIRQENERKTALQLLNFQDPKINVERQYYIGLIATFGDLLVQNKFEEIVNALFHEECKTFVLRNTVKGMGGYSVQPEGFIDFFKDHEFIQRKVLETHVDLEKSTVCQISHCKIFHSDDQSLSKQISFEIFTIRDQKIVKYRGCFGDTQYESEDKFPLQMSNKDKMLLKIKELNYALAGQPDLQRVASFLHENTEYKIWSWENEKCFVLKKENFENSFKNLQENFVITQIVPFEVFSNTDMARNVIVGTYTYHLEPRNNPLGRKFVWLNTCIYAFDQNINIIKINQQGELYNQGEIAIPFEVFSREVFQKISNTFDKKLLESLDLIFHDLLHPDLEMYIIGNKGFGNKEISRGLNDAVDLFKQFPAKNIDWIKSVDFYLDRCSSGYDTVIIAGASEGKWNFSGDCTASEKIMNSIAYLRLFYEKGKMVKFFQILSPVLEPMPSPFDDLSFSAENIKP